MPQETYRREIEKISSFPATDQHNLGCFVLANDKSLWVTFDDPRDESFSRFQRLPDLPQGGASEAKANAHLIAAAPEMLDALKDAVRWLNSIEAKLGHRALVDMMPNNCKGVWHMKETIAKAEGGAQ